MNKPYTIPVPRVSGDQLEFEDYVLNGEWDGFIKIEDGKATCEEEDKELLDRIMKAFVDGLGRHEEDYERIDDELNEWYNNSKWKK